MKWLFILLIVFNITACDDGGCNVYPGEDVELVITQCGVPDSEYKKGSLDILIYKSDVVLAKKIWEIITKNNKVTQVNYRQE